MKPTSLVPYGPTRWCHFCQRKVKINPSVFGDATCPRCGSLLWVQKVSTEFHEPSPETHTSTPVLPLAQNTEFSRRLEDLGGRVEIDYDLNSYCVDLSNSQVTDDDFWLLRNANVVTELDLSNTQVTDAGIRNLARLRNLAVLEIKNTKVTDDSLQFIGQLAQLEVLGLEGTKITDAGLIEIGLLDHLWCLDLENTSITGATFSSMPCLLSLDWLFLSGTKVNHVAIEQLKSLKNLKELWIRRTSVTWTERMHLKHHLKNCIIHR